MNKDSVHIQSDWREGFQEDLKERRGSPARRMQTGSWLEVVVHLYRFSSGHENPRSRQEPVRVRELIPLG